MSKPTATSRATPSRTIRPAKAGAITVPTEPKAAVHDALKFDRRSSIRLPMTAVAMATFALDDGGTVLTGVEIVETSAVGMGIRSPVEVKIGTRFSLFPDKNNWPAKEGIVSRCSWDGEYYRCGLNLSMAKAA